MEGGPLQDDGFYEFGEDYILFCHITTRIDGHPHDGLLGKSGKPGFPTVIIMDDRGRALEQHTDHRNRNVEGFRSTLQRAQAFLELEARASSSQDTSTALDYLIGRISRLHLTVAEGRKEMENLDLSEEEKARLEGYFTNQEVRILRNDPDVLRARDGARVRAGRRCLVLLKENRIPTEKEVESYFWWLLGAYAQAEQDLPVQERIVQTYQEKLDKGENVARYLARQETILARMRIEAGKE